MKTLILVSGGDAPGINATIAHYTRLLRANGHHVQVVDNGFAGLFAQGCQDIDLRVLRLLEGQGGSLYASSREPVLAEPDAQQRLQTILDDHAIDNILMFGGDGSLRYVYALLRQWGYTVIGLPTTIDNDVVGTERTLGFDSACNFAYASINGAIATASALNGRVFMVETLGGDTGFLAVDIAYGVGAHAVLVPEYDFEMAWLGDKLKQALAQDGFALAVLSEGVKAIPDFPTLIPELTGTRLRYVKLGHAQRGATVSHRDRVLAHEMSTLAYQSFLDNRSGVIVVEQEAVTLHEQIIDFDHPKLPDRVKYNQINAL